tara:strand:+ start:109 stop:1077 length:969 start_codon:yes stop_codon:yes gene_type:complete
MKKILIAGGAGFIGSNLCKEFVDSNYEVSVFDNNIQYFYPMNKFSIRNMDYRHKVLLKNVNLIRGNTLDNNDLRRAINNIKPNYIINLAALPLAVTAIKNTEEAFSSILQTTQNFLEIIRDISFLDKYVHISSSMIYGDFQNDPNPEDSKKEPKEIYGSFKLASEYLVKGYTQRYDLKSVIIRPSAVYGPTDNNYRVIQKFIENILDKKKIIANNPDSNRLDFTYVKDLVNGIKLATIKDTGNLEIFNLTRGEGRTLKDVIEILKSKIGDFQIEINQDKSFYPKRGTLDISNAKSKLGFNPKYNLEKGIDDYLSYLQQNDKY